MTRMTMAIAVAGLAWALVGCGAEGGQGGAGTRGSDTAPVAAQSVQKNDVAFDLATSPAAAAGKRVDVLDAERMVPTHAEDIATALAAEAPGVGRGSVTLGAFR